MGRPALGFVDFDQAKKRLANRLRDHGRFGGALLLLENKKRLAEVCVAALDCFLQDGHLRMLASEAQNRSAGNVGMMNVAGQQPAQICRVLMRAAAAAFVHEKFYAVDVAKYSRGSRWGFVFGERNAAKVLALALSIQAHHFRHLAAIDLRSGKAQLFLKSLLQDGPVAGFAEHKGKRDTIVPRATLPTRSFVPKKCFFPPARDIGRRPPWGCISIVKCSGSVAEIAG